MQMNIGLVQYAAQHLFEIRRHFHDSRSIKNVGVVGPGLKKSGICLDVHDSNIKFRSACIKFHGRHFEAWNLQYRAGSIL